MNGVINVLKPPGMTSHDVVSYIRRVSGIKKVGHTGTLDPGAAGILPVCIGKATKIADYIMCDSKTYICSLKLGNASDTYDKYGEFRFEADQPFEFPSQQEFTEILQEFTGKILQAPPSYSAIKINGKRAYELARQGEDIQMTKREVTIHRIELLRYSKEEILMEIDCSKGTYIRSLCNDLGVALHTYGYMNFLLRSRTGFFTLENSHTLEEIRPETIGSMIIPLEACLDMENCIVPIKHEKGLMNGNPVRLSTVPVTQSVQVKIVLENGKFVGIGTIRSSTLYVEKLLC